MLVLWLEYYSMLGLSCDVNDVYWDGVIASFQFYFSNQAAQKLLNICIN
jgi:hypothetical protein